MKAVLVALALASSVAHADSIGIHAYTLHSDSQFCNNNPGLYYRTGDYVVGAYKNSECEKVSFYAGRVFSFGVLDITLGAVTGYKMAPVLPLVVPSVLVGNVRIGLVPDAKLRFNNVHIAFEHKF